MKKFIIIVLCLAGVSIAAEINGNFSTGFYLGTPFWNSENYTDGNTLDPEDLFMRSVNRLRLNGKFGNNFKIRLSALRSDGFVVENRLSETKIYQVYGQYNFKAGHVKAGRIVPFNRWIWGSVDGLAAAYVVNERIKITVLGGMHTPYGLLYDSDNAMFTTYSDLSVKLSKKYSTKVKVYNDEDVTKAGFDFYGHNGKLRYSGNYGYDFTNERIADGGLSLIYLFNRKLNISGNYRLFQPGIWKWSHTNFQPYLIERFLVGSSYRMFGDYTLNFRQMLTMTSENKNYLSYLTVGHKYFTFGLSYLTGDHEITKLGLIASGNYSLFKGFHISGGLSPVNYQGRYDDESLLSIAYFLKLKYHFLNSFSANVNFNYYQFDENDVHRTKKKLELFPLQSKYRGGLTINYFFGS